MTPLLFTACLLLLHTHIHSILFFIFVVSSLEQCVSRGCIYCFLSVLSVLLTHLLFFLLYGCSGRQWAILLPLAETHLSLYLSALIFLYFQNLFLQPSVITLPYFLDKKWLKVESLWNHRNKLWCDKAGQLILKLIWLRILWYDIVLKGF